MRPIESRSEYPVVQIIRPGEPMISKQFAAILDINPTTIREWELQGKIPKVPRRENGARHPERVYETKDLLPVLRLVQEKKNPYGDFRYYPELRGIDLDGDFLITRHSGWTIRHRKGDLSAGIPEETIAFRVRKLPSPDRWRRHPYLTARILHEMAHSS